VSQPRRPRLEKTVISYFKLLPLISHDDTEESQEKSVRTADKAAKFRTAYKHGTLSLNDVLCLSAEGRGPAMDFIPIQEVLLHFCMKVLFCTFISLIFTRAKTYQ